MLRVSDIHTLSFLLASMHMFNRLFPSWGLHVFNISRVSSFLYLCLQLLFVSKCRLCYMNSYASIFSLHFRNYVLQVSFHILGLHYSYPVLNILFKSDSLLRLCFTSSNFSSLTVSITRSHKLILTHRVACAPSIVHLPFVLPTLCFKKNLLPRKVAWILYILFPFTVPAFKIIFHKFRFASQRWSR